MEDFIESENYKLTKNGENEIITDINNLLKNFETLIKLNTIEMNSRKILDASLICETMLDLLLKREGYLLKNNTPFSQIIIFCTNNKIIPLECSEFLNIIRIYKDNVIKGIETSENLTSSFLNAFAYYITWFKNYYTDKFSPEKEFKIENCCRLIQLGNNEKIKLNSIDESAMRNKAEDTFFKSKRNREKNKIKPGSWEKRNYSQNKIFNVKNLKTHEKEYKTKSVDNLDFYENQENKIVHEHLNKLNQRDNLEKLDEQNKLLNEILEMVIATYTTVQDMNEKLDIITYNLKRIQSQSEKLIKNAWSEEEVDRIIQVHTTECVQNILEYQSDITKDDLYIQEEIKLKDNFGNAWNKLSDDSKTYLITSKFMYSKLLTLDEIMDYSGICVLITKALEVEIFNRFFTDFLKYLDENYHKDYSQYPTSLLFQYKKPLIPDRFTMGNIAFVLCYKQNYDDSPEQKKNNKKKLMEYCKTCIFSQNSEEEIEELITSYASSIEEIRKKYRNPSAHRGQINRVTANECFKLVIDVQRLLIKMLDSFDY